MMQTYTLRPILALPDTPRILVYHDTACVAAVPYGPSQGETERIGEHGWCDAPWTPAHMVQLYQFVGSNRHNVAVARPVGHVMQYAVVSDGTLCPACGHDGEPSP